MKKFFIISLVLAFFGGKGLAAVENKKGDELPIKKPIIEVIPESYDFGDVKQHEIVDKIFKVTNKGGADLVFGDIVTTCGCTAVLISSKVIHPGKSGDL